MPNTHTSDRLLGSDFKVKEASHGKQALEILRDEIPDLIITDLMMPWMDGFELIKELEQSPKYSKIPVMIVSARTSEEDKMRVLELGVNDFLSKPFNVHEFHKRVKKPAVKNRRFRFVGACRERQQS